jgi:hypothetical protein
MRAAVESGNSAIARAYHRSAPTLSPLPSATSARLTAAR